MPGYVHPDFARVGAAFTTMFPGLGDGGGSLVVCRRGRPVIDMWAGWADSTRRWTRDTATLVFSASKALAATVIHRLADRGLLDYDEPVASYWPEFSVNGKTHITVRQLLTHQAGLHDVTAVARRPGEVLDHLAMEDRLATLPPAGHGDRPGYHAYTYGWLLAGLARRVTGCGMAELVKRELANPLGVDGLSIGAPPFGWHHHFAPLAGPASRRLDHLQRMVPTLSRVPATHPFAQALYLPGFHRLFAGNNPPVLATEMPSANGIASAAGLCALYTALANNGAAGPIRLLSPTTTRALSEIQTRDRDYVLGTRLHWRMGYYKAPILGLRAPRAFGHCGFGGSGGWADPDTGLSFAFVTNRLAALNALVGGDMRIFRLSQLVFAAARQHDHRASDENKAT